MLSINVYDDHIAVFQELRRRGVVCHVASNQQAARAQFMSETLDYQSLFDGAFYSCFVGAAKPDEAFFRRALAALRYNAASVLFIDDREANVAAARAVGLRLPNLMGRTA